MELFRKNILGLGFLLLAVGSGQAVGACLEAGADEQLCETQEILYATGEGAVIGEKAAALGNVVEIYEYMRNEAEYAPYHGARSSSINTVLGMRGNDVDIATGLIAMMRAQGVKSRYAQGDIRIKKSQLANWLGVVDEDLAVAILNDQGIQNINASDPDYVTFQHVWVEVLVDYNNYRAGNTQSTVACAAEGGACKWIALDASYKQKVYKNIYKTLLRNVDFDYSAYYNAENPASPDYVSGMKNKSPLEVYEEQALAYLRANHPGVTLEDVVDRGVVVRDESGLLPASLPYEVVGAVSRYDSVSAHDVASAVDWTKYLTSTMKLPGCDGIALPTYTVSLAELSTKQLTLTIFEDNGTKIFAHRLDGVQVGSSISAGGITFTCGAETTVVEIGTPIDVELTIGTAPGEAVVVDYTQLMFGGYYLIASGGETSNWTQVERAYKKLLAANDEYPIVVDTAGTMGVAGTPYVDTNGSGTADTGDIELLNHLEAQDALTGGLLYVAQSIYYTRLREEAQRYSRLKGIISPVSAYVGIVSTTHEVEYLNDVPFAVTPGGLLIDLKGIRLNGSWEIDSPATYSNETFRFLGHLGSSLEHEVWQEITGYDAISTMRGIQLALGSGEALLDVNYDPPISNTFPPATNSLGFANSAPADFTANRRQLYGRDLQTWAYTGAEPSAGFNVFQPDVSAIPAEDTRALWLSYTSDSGFDEFVANSDAVENQLIGLSATDGQLKTAVPFVVNGTEPYTFVDVSVNSPSGFAVNRYYKNASNLLVVELNETAQHPDGVYAVVVGFSAIYNGSVVGGTITLNMDVSDPTYTYTCGFTSTTYSGTATELLGDAETCFNDTITLAGITQAIDFLDINKGFSPTTSAYRSFTLNVDEYELAFIQEMRSYMYYVLDPTVRFQYLLPSRLSQGPNYLFSVYVKNGYVNDDLSSSTYAIVNYSNRLAAGGGYVTAEETVEPATSADFNNEVFTNLNLVSVTNNDTVRTPSTADPVSTVTGNMYHDETDVVIQGLGMDYVFTRTYNSDQVKTTTASDLPLSKGWTHSYNMRLIANDYGQNPNYPVAQAPENENGLTSSITYIDERGGELNYLVDDVGGTWAVTAPRMTFDQLALDTPEAGTYTLTFRNGVKYIFSGGDLKVPGNVAKLSRIEDPYGNQLTFTYNAEGQLANIQDNTGISGRTGLTLTYYPVGHVDEGHLASVSDWTGRTWVYSYTDGQLTGVLNPASDEMTYSYVPGTDLLKDIISPAVRDGKKKTMTFSYYENDQAYSYVDQLGNVESLTYDLFRKRTRITNPRGFITEHYYDENGALIKLVEPDKSILQFANNDDGLRYLKRNALGYATTYSYNLERTLDGAGTDTYGQVTREQDALGYTRDYAYGIYDQVTVTKDKNNVEHHKEYYTATDIPNGALKGKLHRVLMPTATVNGVTQTNVEIANYQYNADGTVKRIEEAIDPATPSRKRITDMTYAYDSNGKTITQVVTGATSGGSVTRIRQYDSLWRLISETVERRTSSTDPTLLSLTTSYAYDELGRQVKVTDPLNNITETVYDGNGKVKQVIKRFALNNPGINTRDLHDGCSIDANYPNHHSCVVTTKSYDLADRLLSETDINGNTVHYKYDAMGNVTRVTNQRGYSLYNEYDAMGRLTRMADENGHAVEKDYDLAGRVAAVTDPNGNVTRFTYDALGRKSSITTPEQRVTRFDQYDGNGNLIKQTDANGVSGQQPLNSQGASVYTVYDELNRVVSELNANDEQTSYTYDLLGNLTSVRDAKGQQTHFVYDDLGRLIEVIDPIIESPVDKTTVFTHDELGNVLARTDRNGEVIRTTYDRLNRATLVEYVADGTTQTARYNQYGELDQVANASVAYDYTYDNKQRMTQKLDGRTGLRLRWTYDGAGNLVSKTDYQGNVTTFTYDDSNRLVAMSKEGMLQVSYHYDGAGRLLSRILSNGSATLYQYDKDGLLTKLTQRSGDGTVVDERIYSHDDIGNIIGLIKSDGEVLSYSYDPVYRLSAVSSSVPEHSVSYTYDAVGNRVSKADSAGSYNYVYNNSGNRLDEVRDAVSGNILTSYDYDNNGSRIAKRDSAGTVIESYDYDQRRLISSVTSGGATTTYTYDPNAYRVQKKTGASENNYLLESEHLEAIYDESGALKSSYFRGVIVDEIVGGLERDENGNMQFRAFLHDQLNSVIAMTDHNGQTVESRSYSPFGRDESVSGTSGNTLNYTGREQDNNGLYYYRARYYDPEIGRFLSEDPIGFDGGVNFYAYVKNNPINFSDPSGNLGLSWLRHPESGSIPRTNEYGELQVGDPMMLEVSNFSNEELPNLTALSAGTTVASVLAVEAAPLAMEGVLVTGEATVTVGYFSYWTAWNTAARYPWLAGESMVAGASTLAVPGPPDMGSTVAPAVWLIDNFDEAAGALESGYDSIIDYGSEVWDQGVDAWDSYWNSSSNDFSLSDPYAYSSGGYDAYSSGGFVLYPNKLNTNTLTSVYSK